MKRLLLLLPLLLLTPAAQAVDYLQCEAMQRAYGRAAYETKKLRSSLYDAALEQVMREKCGPPIDYFHPVEEERLAYFECAELTSESRQRIEGIAWANPALIEALSKEEKIKADYNAEGCY